MAHNTRFKDTVNIGFCQESNKFSCSLNNDQTRDILIHLEYRFCQYYIHIKYQFITSLKIFNIDVF